ncbi:MAG: cation diffusion facilitator family transporter [Nitrospinae bacterium]|nr:cation diffusion facilitator family transporter [Nitrospinota bacterium]
MNRQLRTAEAWNVTVAGAVVNMGLVGIKFAAGFIGSSQALIADAVHSLSDLLTDLFLLVTIKVAGKEADEQHPYGHGRAETIGSLVMGGSLLGVGLFILFEIVQKITGGPITTPTWVAAWGAAASILIKEALFFYTLRVGKKISNQSIIANAWEHRSDSLSAVAALLGILGAIAGFPLLDPLAAIVVVFMVEKVGWEIFWQALKDLMDTSLPPEQMKEIKAVIMKTDGVIHFHELRTRRLGADIFVDVHVMVQPNISISEAHNVSETVRDNLRKKAGVADALVHIDAEFDVYYKIIDTNRARVEELVKKEAESIDGVKGVSELIFHLLGGKVMVDFNVDFDDTVTIGEARERVKKLHDNLLRHQGLDMAVIRGRLTQGVLEHEFYPPRKSGGKA